MISLKITITITEEIISYNYYYNENNTNENSSLFSLIKINKKCNIDKHEDVKMRHN